MPEDSESPVTTTVLITGANRGLGLALARGYLARGRHRVLAGCRDLHKIEALEKLRAAHAGALTILRLDVSVKLAGHAAAGVAAENGVDRLDILINNAGIAPGQAADRLEHLDLAFARDAFETNALGAVRVTREFLPLLRKSQRPRVVNITSGAGSLSRKATEKPSYAYAASKAALNMFTRIMAADLKDENLCVVALSPGWVRTDMGGPEADLGADESAGALIDTIEKLTLEQTSRWLDRFGNESEYAW